MSSYASPTDLAQLSMNANAIVGISTADQQAALDSASNEADGYLAAQYTLPLTLWTPELKQVVCNIATYRLMRRRGFNPERVDELIVDDYKDARRWLGDVAAGRINPPGIVGSDGLNQDQAGAPMISTESLRGFNDPPNAGLGTNDDFENSWD